MFTRFAEKHVFYHGTATGTNNEVLRNILKSGLNPNPKKRRYDAPEDVDKTDVMSVRKLEFVTYGGVYLASDLITAMSYATGAQKDLGGDMLIVIAQVETRSPNVTVDEDQFLSTVNIRLSGEIVAKVIRDKYPKIKSDLSDVLTYKLLSDLYELLSSNKILVEDLVRPYLDALNQKNQISLPIDKIVKYYKKEASELIMLSLEFDAVTNPYAEEFSGDPEEIAREFREKTNSLTKRISGLADVVPGRNVRSLAPVTYRGANRILGVISTDGQAGRIWYSADDSTTSHVAVKLEEIIGKDVNWNVAIKRPRHKVTDYVTDATEQLLNLIEKRIRGWEFMESLEVQDEDLREYLEENIDGLIDEHLDEILQSYNLDIQSELLRVQHEVKRCGESSVDEMYENFENIVKQDYESDDPCVDGIVETVSDFAQKILFGVGDSLAEVAKKEMG